MNEVGEWVCLISESAQCSPAPQVQRKCVPYVSNRAFN